MMTAWGLQNRGMMNGKGDEDDRTGGWWHGSGTMTEQEEDDRAWG